VAATTAKLRAAQAEVAKRTRALQWTVTTGIGLCGDEPGLVVSVEAGRRSDTQQAVDALGLDVPICVREIGPIRARTARVAAAQKPAVRRRSR
jgi:hypothetical protein